MKRLAPMTLLALMAWLPLPSEALLASCTASSSSVAFGGYDPISPSADFANGSVTVSCTGVGLLVSYRILLAGGGSGSTASRTLNAGGNTLPYNVYTSAGYSTVWDNVTGVTGGFLIALGGTSMTHTVYGRILAQQPAAAGSYADSLVITVNY
ncbi:spore coat U domain-containing protein [Nevskia sp.]|uniref:Csu type fimbrial protein n=1 Tax=Nevskia sp. TaxID=1929292 RepID=UPI0025F763C5|nr:spore coat U domain-containing protein [Nevskia sp.]